MDSDIIILGNGTDWCAQMVADYINIENVRFFNSRFFSNKKNLSDVLIRLHYSKTANKFLNLPLKSLWNKMLFKRIYVEPNQIIVFFDRNYFSNNESFLKYIKSKAPTIKLVYIFTNIVEVSGAKKNNFISKLSQYYDVICTYDPDDAKKYNYLRYYNIYSPIRNKNIESENQGVLFVGNAKDRLDIILSVYKRLKELEIPRLFFVTGVDEDKQLFRDEIVYNKYLPYEEVVRYVNKVSCILDIVQTRSDGLTLKVCEAVFYNKKLLSTNKTLKYMPFYSDKRIKVFESANEIEAVDVNKENFNEYSLSEQDLFSLNHLIHYLREILT